MRAIRLVPAAVVVLAALAAAALPSGGCYDSPPLKLCGEIPANGCPIGRGGSCDDASCAGLYDCVEGQWTLSVDCSADGGTSSGSGGGDAGADASCSPVTLSHDGELQGCKPDLESPDCPVVAAESTCVERVCLTGCIDFFLCVYDADPNTADHRSWSAVAHCDDNGELVIAQ
jgi:hypothetical protein